MLVVSGDVHESGLFYWEIGEGDARRIIGHEVISSGITSPIPGPDHLKSVVELIGDIGPDGKQIHVTPRGSIRAPAFAEIVVRSDPAPQVGVIYYLSGDSGDRLVNWAGAKFWSRSTGAARFPAGDETTNYTITWLSMDTVPEEHGKAWTSYFVPGVVWDYEDSLHGRSVRCEGEHPDDEPMKYDAPASHWFEVFTGGGECEVDD